MKNARAKIAAAATVVGLGGLAGVALSSNSGQGTPSAAKPMKPKVRTRVIRRTVHVTRHAKPKEGSGVSGSGSPGQSAITSAPPAPAPPPAVTSSSSAPAATPVASTAPVVTHTSGASAPSHHPTAPIHTSSSGGGSNTGGGEVEHEGGDGGHGRGHDD